MSTYYIESFLKPNPAKTQVSAFHLNNREAHKKININWNGEKLQHTPNPVYLGITLNRTLSYKVHIIKIKAKINARNNIICKLANSRWGANPSTLRTSALGLCYSVAEYACPIWQHSQHAKKLGPALNNSCRLITGCLKPTKVDFLYTLAGIAPLDIRRKVATQKERT